MKFWNIVPWFSVSWVIVVAISSCQSKRKPLLIIQVNTLVYLICFHLTISIQNISITACERLILLETDKKELRDYSILLYHCGFYEQSLEYLKLYQESQVNSLSLCALWPINNWFSKNTHSNVADFLSKKTITRFSKQSRGRRFAETDGTP